MANKRWARYRPSRNPTDETTPSKPKPARPQRPKPPKPAPKPAKPAKPAPRGWIIAGIAGVVLVAGIAGVVAASSGDDGPDTDIERETLDVGFLETSLARAAEVEGVHPISVKLDEYSLEVVYLDTAKDELRTFETTHYSSGYTIRVEDEFYVDHDAPPMDLGDVKADVLVRVVDTALEQVDDAERFDLVVDRTATGATQITTEVSDEDYDTATVHATIDGRTVSVDHED